MKKILFPTLALVAFFSVTLLAQATSTERCDTLRTTLKTLIDTPTTDAFKAAESEYYHGCMVPLNPEITGQCTHTLVMLTSYAGSTNVLNQKIFQDNKSIYLRDCLKLTEENAVSGAATLKTTAKVPFKRKPIVVTLDESNWEKGSNQYDFEKRRKTTMGMIDLSIGGIIFDNQWAPAVNWNVIEMPTTFDETKKCPIKGYANVDDPDGDGYGTPRYGNPGKVFCLKTAEGNFAKLEVLKADYDDKLGRVFQFKYLFNQRKIRTFK